MRPYSASARPKRIKLITEGVSGWINDAKKRQKYKRSRKIKFKLNVRYLRLRRAFLLFLHGVIGRFYNNPMTVLMTVFVAILIVMFLLLLHPFIEYFTGFEMFPKFYD